MLKKLTATSAILGPTTISRSITPSARYAECGRDLCAAAVKEKKRLSLDGRRTKLHEPDLGAVLELGNFSRVRGRPASMPHRLALALDDMYNGLTYYKTLTPVRKSGGHKAAQQGSWLVLEF